MGGGRQTDEAASLDAGATRSSSEMAALLRRTRLFADLPSRNLKAFIRYATVYHAGPGVRLIEQGEPGHFMAVLVSGSCVVHRDGEQVSTLGPGDCLGEMSMIDGLPCSATVVPTEPTEVLVLRRSDFDHVLKVAPGLGRTLLAQLSLRLREFHSGPAD
ncbi:MAG: cyclic nucleotide-binding domain-containing protein [Actinomycetota bacterium]